MAVSPSYARTMVGKWVESHSAYGIHQGILREIRPDGIVLEMPRGPVVGMVAGSSDLVVDYADHPTEENCENVQFFRPFFPFFFIPFFLLFALRRRRLFI